MKILYIISYFTPKRGGDVNICYNLSKQLVKRGHEVTIITTDFEFDEKYGESIRKEGVKVITFQCIINVGLFLYTPAIRKWLKLNIKNFDIIHMHNFRSYQNNAVYHIANKYRIPYILQAHGSVLPFFAKQKLKKLYDWIWGYKIIKYASKAIAVSKAEVKQYKQMGVSKDKIITIPNGIDIKEFDGLPPHGKFIKKYNIKKDNLILFLGRIHKRKGIDFLIKSFSELIKELNDAVLVIVGHDDGYEADVKKLIATLNLSNKIKLLGYIDEKDKLSAYVDAEVLVYPAIFEIFGLIPFEAMMCGTPVIVTDDCGCGEMVEESGGGYLVKYRDVNELKSKMKMIIENPKKGKKMAMNGKKFIFENLLWDKIVTKMEQVYDNFYQETCD